MVFEFDLSKNSCRIYWKNETYVYEFRSREEAEFAFKFMNVVEGIKSDG